MKLLLAGLFLIAATSHAQSVDVNGVNTSENTTIEIKKGSSSGVNKKKYEINEGTDEVAGDTEVLLKTAQNSYKQACKDWKAEIKEGNKENKVISISCGTMRCSKEGVESLCKSTGTYKVRVLVEE